MYLYEITQKNKGETELFYPYFFNHKNYYYLHGNFNIIPMWIIGVILVYQLPMNGVSYV